MNKEIKRMHKINKKLLTLLFVVSLVAYSCSFSVGEEEIKFERTDIAKDNKEENTKKVFKWKLSYDKAVIDNKPERAKEITDKIVKELLESHMSDEFLSENDSVKISRDNMSENKSYEDIIKQVQDRDYENFKEDEFVKEMTVEHILYKKNLWKNILCYEYIYYLESDDLANPYMDKKYLNLYLKDMRVITIDDIVDSKRQNELKEIIYKQLMKDNDVSSIEKLYQESFFEEEYIEVNNFFINETGLVFFFNRGEIAARYKGEIEVLIPFEDIEKVMRENSPIKALYKL